MGTCHSSFKHYYMFHDSHRHGGNNYGNIINITNNCGGNCGGNFLEGLYFSFGYGIGNLLSGFGLPMGGYSPYNSYAGNLSIGTLLGGGGSSGCTCGCGGNNWSSKTDRTPSSRRREKFEDPDNKTITDLRDKIKDTDATEEDLNRYIQELEELKKGLTDNYKHDKDVEELSIDALITEANKKIEKIKNASTAPKPGDEKIDDTMIENMTKEDITSITPEQYDKLKNGQKTNLKNKILKLSENDRKDLALNQNIAAELRIAAKQSFYETGYENVKIEELTDEALQNIVAVIDTSGITDFNVKEVTDIVRDNDRKIKSFKMTAQTGTQVTYHQVDVVDGELIFHGKKDNQEYAVQKDSNNKYRLMQYPYHRGHGSADVTT